MVVTYARAAMVFRASDQHSRCSADSDSRRTWTASCRRRIPGRRWRPKQMVCGTGIRYEPSGILELQNGEGDGVDGAVAAVV